MQQATVQSIDSLDDKGIYTIERAQIVISVLLTLAAIILWPTPKVWGGVFAGSIIAYLNFRLLRRVVKKIVATGHTEKPAVSALRFIVKMVGLFFIVGFLVLGAKVSTLALLVGFSSMVLAISYEGLKSLF